jgi:CubicO group peptidase (beta-lactamase class C family)
MKKLTYLFPFIAALLILYFAGDLCKDDGTVDCANDSCFYLDTFAANIRSALKDSCMGFSYVINYKGGRKRWGADGLMRTARDGGNKPYDLYAKNQIASMSKTLTALATLQLLKKNGLTTYTKIQNYLPTAWAPFGPNIDKITFRDLLRHESGIRNTTRAGCNGEWYDNCSCKVKEGVIADSMGVQQYNNMNYSLLRIIIPRLVGFLPVPFRNDTSTANQYIRYVRKNVLDTCGMGSVIGCSEDTSLHYYVTPYFNSRGYRMGDNTLVAGARGWYMSAPDYANVITILFNSEAVLNKAWLDTMKINLLGCFGYGGRKGNYLWHNGFTGGEVVNSPGDTSRGLVNTCWMYFSNGIDVVCMVNSNLPRKNPTDLYTRWFPEILATAYDNAWKHK